jgi:alpha-ketoglutarate-dependent 2,4-dichlorophenoxyacetate dioxygenase
MDYLMMTDCGRTSVQLGHDGNEGEVGAYAAIEGNASMTITIRQIHPVVVGEVEGVDLRRPLSADEVAAIEAGGDRYAVLVVHAQPLSGGQRVAVGRPCGAIEAAGSSCGSLGGERGVAVELAAVW